MEWNKSQNCGLFLYSFTVTRFLEVMETGKNRDKMRWLEYGKFHLEIPTLCLFSNVSRNMAIVSLWWERSLIHFEFYHLGDVCLSCVQYFYSTSSLYVSIELIFFRLYFAGITVLKILFFGECVLDFFSFFLSCLDVIAESLEWLIEFDGGILWSSSASCRLLWLLSIVLPVPARSACCIAIGVIGALHLCE